MKYCLFVLTILIAFTAYSQDDPAKSDWANLHKYAAANQLLPPPSKTTPRVVFMGNSITEFWQYKDSSFFVGHHYIDRGISAQTTPQMLIRFRPDVIALKPSVVVILAGINDIAENNGPIALEDILGNIKSMVELAQSNHIKVVLSSVLPAISFYWHPGLQPAEKIIRFNEMLKAYAKENKLVYVDYYSKMVDERKGLNKAYSDDEVHPNVAGYKVMEPLVIKAIHLALQQHYNIPAPK